MTVKERVSATYHFCYREIVDTLWIPLLNKVLDHFGWSMVNAEFCPARVALNLVRNESFYRYYILQKPQPSAIYLENHLSNADPPSSLSTNHVITFDEQNPTPRDDEYPRMLKDIYKIFGHPHRFARFHPSTVSTTA